MHNAQATWRDFTSKYGLHQIDHFLFDRKFFSNISDCLTTYRDAISNHSSLLLKLNVKCTRKIHKKVEKLTKWENLINANARE